MNYETHKCRVCGPDGTVQQTASGACPDCHGTGKFTYPHKRKKSCKACTGTGRTTSGIRKGWPCKKCAGNGYTKVPVKTACKRCKATGVISYIPRNKPRAICPVCLGEKTVAAKPLINLGEIIQVSLSKDKQSQCLSK